MEYNVFIVIMLFLTATAFIGIMAEDNTKIDPKDKAEKTILVSYYKKSSKDPRALTKEQIEKLESDLKDNYCKEKGCEIQHLKAVGILILHFKNLKSQVDEVKNLNSILPEGVLAEGDQVVSIG